MLLKGCTLEERKFDVPKNEQKEFGEQQGQQQKTMGEERKGRGEEKGEGGGGGCS